MTVNINDNVTVTLTKEGAAVYNNHYDELNSLITSWGGKPTHFNRMSEGDKITLQIWLICKIFGAYMDMGLPAVFESNSMEVK